MDFYHYQFVRESRQPILVLIIPIKITCSNTTINLNIVCGSIR